MCGGIRRDTEIPHLAANLFVGVIGVQERIELPFELFVENRQPGLGVEVIAGAPLHGEGARLRQRHALA